MDESNDVHFNPGVCAVVEFNRYTSERTEHNRKELAEDLIGDWIQTNEASSSSPEIAGRVQWIFACTVSTDLDTHGDFLSASEKLELSISKETFFMLTQRFPSFDGLLDAWKYRASAGCVIRHVDYDETTGSAISINFIISIRLSSSFTSLIAVHHDFASRSSVVLALRVNPHDQDRFNRFQDRQQRLIGHPLFVMTLLLGISLDSNFLYMHKIRRELGVIEKATGQHGWLEIPAIDALAHDSELSRLGHAAEIHVSIFRRRLDFLKHYLDSSQQTLNELDSLISSALGLPVGLKREYEQWLGNLAMQFRLRQVDLTYYQRRVDNQITAIYGLLSQRDNMLGVSVAIEPKKISEASKRDGSSLKSLTVLATLFFPATYIATLFTLPHFTKTPLWVYWTVAVPLTLLVFISWSSWTFYRQRKIAQETNDQEINRDVELDPEVAFASSSNATSSTFLVSTLRQIRSHTKAMHHSSVSSRHEVKEVDVGGGGLGDLSQSAGGLG